MSEGRKRFFVSLLGIGAGFLVLRTLIMLYEGALDVLVSWVVALLFLEMVIDAVAMLICLHWAIAANRKDTDKVLWATSAVIIVHAVRVAIFVLGRTGPWIDFDIQPAARALHAARWTWGGVYFAGTMATISVIGLIIFLYVRNIRR